ncbi:hypothetical protein [Gallaecimonas sp. GXIMD1310]|uniref:hypothetical protein n=1 Tax=Gallaecimonas sp. GXIMD1310 TaxID=3131926 RepID=UPI00324E594F
MRQLIERLGSQPRRSVKRFLTGFVLFMLGLLLIYLGHQFDVVLQIPGIAVGAAGFCVALVGYTGILCNRISQFLNR